MKKRMNITETGLLTEKYLAGTTTIKEEELLLKLLRQKGKNLSDEEKVLMLMLGGASDCRRQQAERGHKRGETVIRAIRRWGWAAAAIILIAVVSTRIWNSTNSKEVEIFGIANGKAITNSEEALQLAEQAFNDIAYEPTENIDIQW